MFYVRQCLFMTIFPNQQNRLSICFIPIFTNETKKITCEIDSFNRLFNIFMVQSEHAR